MGSNDSDTMTILAGMPQDETIFEYLTGCWKRLYMANREMTKIVSREGQIACSSQGYTSEEKANWSATSNKLKGLIVSYCGMTLEDPTMFPQPAK